MNYSRISPEAGMVMKRPPMTISPSGRVLEQDFRTPALGFLLVAAPRVEFLEKGRAFGVSGTKE
jgi:hypothetical protein